MSSMTATTPSYISLSEAARRMRVSVKDARTMLLSGKIQGGTLPNGEMIVTVASLPMKKEDLPEYQKYSHLANLEIGIAEAARKYGMAFSTIQRWAQVGYISQISRSGQKILLNEQDVAYCVGVYRKIGSRGRRLFNPDGTPYKPKTGPLAG